LALVLVVSNSQDAHVPPVVERLLAEEVKVARLDTDRLGRGCDVSFNVGADGACAQLAIDGVRFDTRDVTAVWWRRPETPVVLETLKREARRFAEAEWAALMQGAVRTVDALWVNHPEALRYAGHKLLQLRLARSIGFDVPPTCVSADPEEVRRFHHTHGGRVIAKLVSGGPPRVEPPDLQYMVYATPVSDSELADDAALRSAPATYQAYVDKDHELRVTVVADHVHACAIHSQATERTRIDWRRYDLENTPHRAVTLDPDLRERCLALTRRLGLVYAAIDLIVTPHGGVVFLEINPNGQWGWIEHMTGLPIADTLASTLAGAGVS
jgi:glutathione synthase/RimK-type ligase-like ATP-grasp enzyme